MLKSLWTMWPLESMVPSVMRLSPAFATVCTQRSPAIRLYTLLRVQAAGADQFGALHHTCHSSGAAAHRVEIAGFDKQVIDLLVGVGQIGMQLFPGSHLLLHQANIRIMEVVAKKLGLPMDRVITNIDEYFAP